MAPQLILTGIQKAFLQIGLKEEDREAFRFCSISMESKNTFALLEYPLESSQVHLCFEPQFSII